MFLVVYFTRVGNGSVVPRPDKRRAIAAGVSGMREPHRQDGTAWFSPRSLTRGQDGNENSAAAVCSVREGCPLQVPVNTLYHVCLRSGTVRPGEVVQRGQYAAMLLMGLAANPRFALEQAQPCGDFG